jgi:hypothetical protein
MDTSSKRDHVQHLGHSVANEMHDGHGGQPKEAGARAGHDRHAGHSVASVGCVAVESGVIAQQKSNERTETRNCRRQKLCRLQLHFRYRSGTRISFYFLH